MLSSSTSVRTLRRAIGVVLVILLIVVVAVWADRVPLLAWLDALRDWMRAAGPTGLIGFVLAYTLLTLVLGPAGLLSVMAGLVWGLWGFPVVIVAATTAALVALFVGRHLARERVLALAARDRRSQALVRAVSQGGWRLVALIRLSPMLPFGAQNYLLSITDIRALPYALATAAAIAPSSALYVYLGSLGDSFGQSGGAGAATAPEPLRWLLIGIGVVATVLVVREVSRRARTALVETVDADDGIEAVVEALDPQARTDR